MTWIVFYVDNVALTNVNEVLKLEDHESYEIRERSTGDDWLVIPERGYHFNLSIYDMEIYDQETLPLSWYLIGR